MPSVENGSRPTSRERLNLASFHRLDMGYAEAGMREASRVVSEYGTLVCYMGERASRNLTDTSPKHRGSRKAQAHTAEIRAPKCQVVGVPIEA